MISIILTIIAFILIVSLYFDQPLTLNLLSFISTVILGFIIVTYHLITLTLYDLSIIMIIASILIIMKHRHLFNFSRGRHFLKNMCINAYQLALFLIACFYISTVSIPVINGLALWLSAIAFSTFLHLYVMYLGPLPLGVIHFIKCRFDYGAWRWYLHRASYTYVS